jgi:hypothetical protein
MIRIQPGRVESRVRETCEAGEEFVQPRHKRPSASTLSARVGLGGPFPPEGMKQGNN